MQKLWRTSLPFPEQKSPPLPHNRGPACQASCKTSPIALEATSRQPARSTPEKPTHPTGSIFPLGAGAPIFPPHPQAVGLYITACASGTAERGMKANSVATIERRLSSISWNYAQRGLSLDRKDRHIATVMAGIRNSHGRPPVQKEAVMATDVIAMLETLDRGTPRGVRDRAMLLVGYAGGRRAPRSSASISRWIRPKTAVAGSKSSIRACSSLCVARPDGGRSRSAAAQPMRPARSPQLRPGSSSPSWLMARFFAG